jgi:hypothetical protein
MTSLIDFMAHNTGLNLRRKSTRKPKPTRPYTPLLMTPAVVTSTGIIAIPYSRPSHTNTNSTSTSASSTSTTSPSTPHSSSSSARSFSFDASSPTTASSEQSRSSDVEIAARPVLPKRSASRRTVPPRTVSANSAVVIEHERPMTPPTSVAVMVEEDRLPPIPAKSPYRASRAMMRLQGEMVDVVDEQQQQVVVEEDEQGVWF